MNKELEQLTKAIDLSEQAVETLSKSHVKEYTRTSASGTAVQVKEHDDARIVHQQPTGRKGSGDQYSQSTHNLAEVGNKRDAGAVSGNLEIGHLMHHDDHDDDSPAVAKWGSQRHGNSEGKTKFELMVHGPKKAVFEAHNMVRKITNGSFNTNDFGKHDKESIARHVKEKTGHDIHYEQKKMDSTDAHQQLQRLLKK